MPVNVFSADSLRAATPGLGRLAMAIGGGGQGGAFQKGQDDGLSLQSKLAQAMSQITAHEASAAASRAKAEQDAAETRTMAGRGAVGDELLAGDAGTDLPTVRAYREQLATGRPAMTSATGDADTDNLIGIAPQAVVSSEIAKTLAKLSPRYAGYRTNTKDMKPDDLAQARKLDRESDLSDDIMAGNANRNTVGGAQAAAGGKNLYHADSTGAVLDLFAGGLNTDNPMAGSTINLRNQQGAQAKAGAAENYAQAEAARSLAEQRRQVSAAGPGGGGMKAPQGYRWTAGANGENRLEAIPGGPKDPAAKQPAGPGKMPAEIQRMTIAMQALESGLNEYETLLKDFNPRSGAMLKPETRARVKALMADLQMQYKEAQALGALTGPDMEILGRALTDPTSLAGALYGRGGLNAQLSEARSGLNRRRTALADQFSRPDLGPGGGAAAGSQPDPLNLFTAPKK